MLAKFCVVKLNNKYEIVPAGSESVCVCVLHNVNQRGSGHIQGEDNGVPSAQGRDTTLTKANYRNN